MIQEALYNYSADQIAKFDFALESAGGHVVDSSDTFDPANTKAQLFGFTLPITITRNFVGVVIQVHTCIHTILYMYIILYCKYIHVQFMSVYYFYTSLLYS